MAVVGIDVGSLSTESVILNGDNQILTHDIRFTGASIGKIALVSFREALSLAQLKAEDISYIVATGYGRQVVSFANTQVTEISCQAKGVHFLFPDVKTIIDVGGQDSKIIRLAAGQVVDFAMNDRCAAGTGRFLEVMAHALEVDLEEMGELSQRSSKELAVSSTCTVFAESEVISLIAAGYQKEDILAGLHRAIAKRVIGLLGRVGVEERIAATGGVAKNRGVVAALQNILGTELLIPKEPQITGALGAALIAQEKMLQGNSR